MSPLRRVTSEAKLLLIGIPVALWTLLPIYHLVLFAISSKEEAFSGKLWPDHPTLHNFAVVFKQDHYFLIHFWRQLGNSLIIAVAVGAITLFIATCAAFAISRLRVRGGRLVMNLALFTYFIPAAFLAVPMYKAMGSYGLLNNQWSLILAMITLASPYAIWVLKQASDKLPLELDEAARIEGCGPLAVLWKVYVPLARPVYLAYALVSISYHWNNFLWPLIITNSVESRPLTVGLQVFSSGDQGIDWSIITAATLLTTAPLLIAFLLFQRQFVQSFMRAGIR